MLNLENDSLERPSLPKRRYVEPEDEELGNQIKNNPFKNWQWLLAAVCAFMAWMNLLLLIRKLPRFGIYVVMFFDILRTFSRFFIIFVLFILAFSIAFYVIMQNRVGLAVDDIKSVQEKAELKRLSMQVDLVLQVETSMPFIRKITCRSYCCFYPNQMTFMKRLRNRFGFDPSMELLTDPKITEKDGGLTTELRRELQSQNSQIHTLQTNIDVMYEKQIQMDSMIRAILRHLKIDYQEMDT
uniref:Ion_trans domain-containing protein n=1 Tax=Heterorhabditis bacteriophora TaxID=37862 RepID=A0A1I7XEA2_HETBA